ncbi:hypothetical protein GGE65_003617 [Skermanella aerolata]|uniref:hypothetical protein n=1 Tax=Skermanella aerolata TaxID=393310 RepID=UPI003D1C8794
MRERGQGVPLSDLMEPLLGASDGNDGEVLDAVNLVAEAIAALGITVTDAQGHPLPGVTDTVAVLAMLQQYRQQLVRRGRMEDAVGLGDLAKRIAGLK